MNKIMDYSDMSLQDDILKVISEWQKDYGKTPTVRQIASKIGLSKSTISDHCARMNRDGIISREKRCRRVRILTEEIKSFDEMRLSVQSLSYQNKRLLDDVERLKAGLRLAEAHTAKKIAEVISAIPSMSELSWVLQAGLRKADVATDNLTLIATKAGLIAVDDGKQCLTEFGEVVNEAFFG